AAWHENAWSHACSATGRNSRRGRTSGRCGDAPTSRYSSDIPRSLARSASPSEFRRCACTAAPCPPPRMSCGPMAYRRRRVMAISSSSGALRSLDEALDEGEGRLGYLAPAAVDGESMAAARHLDDLGHSGIPLLLLEGGVGYRPGDRVVLFARQDEERTALRIVSIDTGFGPGIEIG